MNPDLVLILFAVAWLLIFALFAMIFNLIGRVKRNSDDDQFMGVRIDNVMDAYIELQKAIGEMVTWADKIELEIAEINKRLDMHDNRLDPLERLANATSVTVTPSSTRKSRATKKALGEVADAVKQKIDQEMRKLDDSKKT